MKTEKELNELKEEMKRMQQKLAELTEEELKQVTGGDQFTCPLAGQTKGFNYCIEYPCGNNLQRLMGEGWFCPIAQEYMD